MNLSYWEIKSWFQHVDFTIIGSGIVGLNCAIHIKQRFPKANILVLEKGMLSQGASTKNAGFACFGSLSEILSDLESHSEEEVFNLVKKRYDGLQLLRNLLGDIAIDYQNHGGYELFAEEDKELYNECFSEIKRINSLLFPIFKQDLFDVKSNAFNFKNIHTKYIFNSLEGQIDTGRMMLALLKKAQVLGIKILNTVEVLKFHEDNSLVKVETNELEITTSKLVIATNGFASQLINENVKPARAQVLITKPVENLHIKGTFHLHRGYYYFRNIDNRILLGGGRNLDLEGEETMEFGQTLLVQNKLETLLKETILPDIPFEIEHRWSGIMGLGNQKKALVKQLSNNVYCGVRLGGMGIAIGSLIGKELSDLIT